MDHTIGSAGGCACGIEPAIRGQLRRRRSAHALVLSCSVIALGLPGLAQAHVRWFSQAVDDRAAPQPLTALLASPVFLPLMLLALVVIACVHGIDQRLAAGNTRFMHLQRRVDSRMSRLAAPVLRVGCGLFFAAIALYFRAQPITLTPELKSPVNWVVPLQLAIAGGMLLRAGVIPGCAGMVLLYLYSAWLYGPVHLLDYHLFLGVCALLYLDRRSPRHGEGTGLLVMRLLVATSFLWVGVEKWLYPEWTCDILEHQLPKLAMGLDPDFWAMAAGFVEVALAFLLLFGGVSSQLAAAALLLLMAAAIPLVGVVDAIGHLPMLFSLFVLATTRNRLQPHLQRRGCWRCAEFCGVFLVGVTGVTGLYFLAHEFAAAMSLRIGDAWVDMTLATAASVALGTWVARVLAAPSPPPGRLLPSPSQTAS